MKTLLLTFTLLSAFGVSAKEYAYTQPTYAEFQKLNDLLEANNLKAADKLIKSSSDIADDRKNMMLADLSTSSYGATRVLDEGEFIKLEGSAWLVAEGISINGKLDKASILKIHKATNRIVLILGQFTTTVISK
ncbi:hypothetical protein [Rubritalea sp.]|uniref:hypothetical protein n=1 Tax=Rubritalea sp. TaxID=2109375 RepID=UPI003EF2B247